MCGRFAQKNIIKSTSDIVKTIIGKVDNIDKNQENSYKLRNIIKKYIKYEIIQFQHYLLYYLE